MRFFVCWPLGSGRTGNLALIQLPASFKLKPRTDMTRSKLDRVCGSQTKHLALFAFL